MKVAQEVFSKARNEKIKILMDFRFGAECNTFFYFSVAKHISGNSWENLGEREAKRNTKMLLSTVIGYFITNSRS